MARQKKSTQPQAPRAKLELTVSRTRAEEVLEKQIEEGKVLLDQSRNVGDETQYDEWREAQTRWRKFSTQALKAIYSTDEPADEFDSHPGVAFISLGETSVAEKVADSVDDLRRYINTLRSLHERLEFVPTLVDRTPAQGNVENETATDVAIFVVHGHDARVKEQVVRQLEAAGDYPVKVLHEQANQGLTLIEKFEQHASLSSFAVVLLTPDDVGAAVRFGNSIEPDNLNRRARQNVIFELGYFVGAFGRARVAVLYDEGVELPSDYQGIVYISLSDETWRYRLLKELKAAGLDYDLNKLL
jgi:predicted nucleotide-binding protein